MTFLNLYNLILETSFSELPDKPPYGFVIHPNGDFTPARYMAHDEACYAIINKDPQLKKEFLEKVGTGKIAYDVLMDESLSFLYGKHYNRVVIENGILHYMKPSSKWDFRVTNSQMSVIRDIAKHYHLDLYR